MFWGSSALLQRYREIGFRVFGVRFRKYSRQLAGSSSLSVGLEFYVGLPAGSTRVLVGSPPDHSSVSSMQFGWSLLCVLGRRAWG